jgi:hypothetical protein
VQYDANGIDSAYMNNPLLKRREMSVWRTTDALMEKDVPNKLNETIIFYKKIRLLEPYFTILSISFLDSCKVECSVKRIDYLGNILFLLAHDNILFTLRSRYA